MSRAWQWVLFVWDEQVVHRVGRLACRWFSHHNVSCRARDACARAIVDRS